MIPMKDGKVCWPKGIGSKKERLEWLEREYAKRLQNIKLLQDMLKTHLRSAQYGSLPGDVVVAYQADLNVALALDKIIYSADDIVPKDPTNG